MTKKNPRAAGRYYASASTKRRGSAVSWQWLMAGVAIGLVLGYTFFHKKQQVNFKLPQLSASQSERPPGKTPKRPHVKGKGVTGQAAPEEQTAAQADEAEFDFYKLLPQGGVKSSPVVKAGARVEKPKPARAKLVEEEDGYAQPPEARQANGTQSQAQTQEQMQDQTQANRVTQANRSGQQASSGAPQAGDSTQSAASAYAVQVGSFERYEQADQLQAQLVLLGFEAHIRNEVKQGKPLRKVWLGPFANKAEAQQMQEKLANSGIKNTLLYAR